MTLLLYFLLKLNGQLVQSRLVRCKYQLVVVVGGEVGVSVGNQEQLPVGVDGEETQEVVLPASHKVSDGLGLGLRHRFAPTVDFGAAVVRHSDRCGRNRIIRTQTQYV